jgi:exo-beta-1,3-glucanase (GH17 family)
MVSSFLKQLLVLALGVASVQAQDVPIYDNTTDVALSAGVVRRLADGYAPGNVAACYAPFHNAQYPLNGGSADVNAIRNAIDEDFRIMSQHFTHVRTYYAQHFGIEVAPIAAKYGLKLFLGVFLTKESWGAAEVNAAVNAIKQHSDTVEVISVGSENLKDFAQRSGDILGKINEIKSKAGNDAGRVKYATAQRANEFIESKYDDEMRQLYNNLDILGVNIYPFFDNGYDGNNPTKLLDDQWNKVVNKYPGKIVLTETGFPTDGKPSSLSPRVVPSLESSFKYYEAVINWSPAGYQSPKYWFQAFDRRADDPAANPDLERYFGFFTTQKNQKRDNYPRRKDANVARTMSSGSACSLEEGVNYAGNDIGTASSSNADGCFSACNNFGGCAAFTWTNYNGGTCWLKSAKGSTSSNGQSRSAVTLEAGVNYNGNDIGTAAGKDAQACIPICKQHGGCHAFTWSNYNGGTCWLKSGKDATSANGGVTSGVVC